MTLHLLSATIFDKIGDDCNDVVGCYSFGQWDGRGTKFLVENGRQRVLAVHRIMPLQSRLKIKNILEKKISVVLCLAIK